MSAPTRATTDGRAYLDLRKLARDTRRPVDELLQLYILEAFLSRLSKSAFSKRLILKGGVLLAAFDERRPTRDIDLQCQTISNDIEAIRRMACEIASLTPDDGVLFDTTNATAEMIRDEEEYSGVRVHMNAQLASARHRFRIDVNVGDPIIPAPENMLLPRLLGGQLSVRGYPLAMVHAEKIVTAITRGTVNTRWRDFADIYLLSRHHPINGDDLTQAVHAVANHRKTQLRPLADVLVGYGEIGQRRWAAWRRRQKLEDRLPEDFSEAVRNVIEFADPAIAGAVPSRTWDPLACIWP